MPGAELSPYPTQRADAGESGATRRRWDTPCTIAFHVTPDGETTPSGLPGVSARKHLGAKTLLMIRRSPDSVPPLHLLVAGVGLGVEGGEEVAVEDGHQLLAERSAPHHPLEIAPPAVLIGAIEPATGEGADQPPEEGLVIRVHAERHLRLLAVAAEMTLADQQPQEDADFDRREPVRLRGTLAAGLFHQLGHSSSATLSIAATSPPSRP